MFYLQGSHMDISYFCPLHNEGTPFRPGPPAVLPELVHVTAAWSSAWSLSPVRAEGSPRPPPPAALTDAEPQRAEDACGLWPPGAASFFLLHPEPCSSFPVLPALLSGWGGAHPFSLGRRGSKAEQGRGGHLRPGRPASSVSPACWPWDLEFSA